MISKCVFGFVKQSVGPPSAPPALPAAPPPSTEASLVAPAWPPLLPPAPDDAPPAPPEPPPGVLSLLHAVTSDSGSPESSSPTVTTIAPAVPRSRAKRVAGPGGRGPPRLLPPFPRAEGSGTPGRRGGGPPATAPPAGGANKFLP